MDVFVERFSVVRPRSHEPKEYEQFSERAKRKLNVKRWFIMFVANTA